jgi:GTP-binding protein LepA
LGFGFRCGFLGMLHLEIIQERLEREFDMTVITTVPNVSYHAYTHKNPTEAILVNNPTDLPEPSRLERVEEPFIKASIITKSDFVGPVMSLCIEKRGQITNQTYLNPGESRTQVLICLWQRLYLISMTGLKLYLKDTLPLIIPQ